MTNVTFSLNRAHLLFDIRLGFSLAGESGLISLSVDLNLS